MKIAYINTVYREKSTGRTYAELKAYNEEKGNECKVFYGINYWDEENTIRIGNKFSYYSHNLFSRLTGLEGYFSYFATKKLIKQLKSFNPDVIHLGSLHGHYLHLSSFLKFLSKFNKPVFITTHDCWSFTGKCPAFKAINCDKWKHGCDKCQSKKLYPKSYFFDFSKKMYKDKKKLFSAIKKLHVICVSEWIAGMVRESFLRNKKISVNYNWIDTKNFHYISHDERLSLRKELSIKDSEYLIIAVSSNWSKGTPRYEDLAKLMEKIRPGQKLLVVGKVHDAFPYNENVIYLSFVSDVGYLAKLYGCADVFVHFSLEDSFGKVIAEAQACGVPAIVYDSTACPEIARIGHGFVVPPRDVDKAYERILSIMQLSKDERENLRKERSLSISKILNKETRMQFLLDSYNEAVNNIN